MRQFHHLALILLLSLASCGRDDGAVEDERLKKLTSQVNTVSLEAKVGELPQLVISSKNIITFNSVYLGKEQEFTLAATGGEIKAISANKYILKPTGTTFEVTPTIKKEGGDVTLPSLAFPVMQIPKPTFSVDIGGSEYDGHTPVAAAETIVVKVVANPDYLFLFSEDNSYEVESIHLYASRGGGARAHIHTYNFATSDAQAGLVVNLGAHLGSEASGTAFYLELDKVTLTNHAGEEVEFTLPSLDRNLTFIIE